jgi:hypothetical protein
MQGRSKAVDNIIKRKQSLETIHTQWRGQWQDLGDYILPRKNNPHLENLHSPGRTMTDKLFDSTAVHSNEILASSMAGSLTNQGMKWFSLKTRDEAYNDVHAVQMWLQDCTHRMHRAVQQSNFASEILEVYLDLGALGTGAMIMEEKPMDNGRFAGVQFRACSIGEYLIDEDGDGFVNTVFRTIPMTALQIATKWPKSVTAATQRIAETQPDSMMTVLHAVFPRKGVQPGLSSKTLPYASYYIEIKERSILDEGGFHENPYAVPRWTKVSYEKYGRGPGHTALPDVKVLNKVKELSLKTWGKVLDPPMAIQHDGIVGSLRLTPGGINYTRGLPREVMEQMKIDARFDISQIKEEELRGSIRNIYWSNQLELQQGPQMTAQEVMVRYEMMQRLLGPTLGRLEAELLNPVVKRVFGIMMRAGAFLEPPQELDAYVQEGGTLDIEYESPIARAQRSGDATAVQSVIEFVAPMMEMQPEILDNFDMDEVVRMVADVRAVPQKVMRAKEEIEILRDERAAAQEKQAKQEEMFGMGETLGKMAPAIKEGADLGVMGGKGKDDVEWAKTQ